MIIRNVTESDASQLVNLLMQMGYELTIKQMISRIKSFNKNNHQIYIAEQNKIIIGVIAFGCYEHFRIDGGCCHIDTLVIEANHRGNGVGKKLLQEVEKYASECGIKTIELITANHRMKNGTHAFYKSSGYKDHTSWDYSYFAKELF